MRGKLHLLFDFKTMGVNAYVPVVTCILLFVYGWMKVTSIHSFIFLGEYILPVMAAWWSIFLFQDVLEEEGSETLFSYPLTRWKLGVARVMFFFSVYSSFLISMLLILEFRRGEELFISLALQYGIQSFFMAGLGFLTMVLITNAGWALLLPITYTFAQMFSRGEIAPLINIFFFNRYVLDVSAVIQGSIKTFIMGVVCFVAAQYFLNRFKRFR